MKRITPSEYQDLETSVFEELGILGDTNSEFKKALEATISARKKLDNYRSSGSSKLFIGDTGKWFYKHAVLPLFLNKVSGILKTTKSSDDCVKMWESIRLYFNYYGYLREMIISKAISLATCKQALEIYRLVHSGKTGRLALERAESLAESQDEWWQVAVHAHKCGNKPVWKKSIKALATKMK